MRLLTAILIGGVLAGQPASVPRFEAAAIKPVSDGGSRPHLVDAPSGVDYASIWMFDLIRRAWRLQNYELAFQNGFQQRWSVAARAPSNTTLDQIPVMLQNLLIERFQLQFHRETQEMAAWVLLPAKGGPKLKLAEKPAGGLGFGRSPQGGRSVSGNVSLDLLAQAIAPAMGRPVINQTGLTGVYEIRFDYDPDNSAPGDSNLQHALEDTLGLRMEYRKVPINIFVVDRIAPAPTDN